MFRSERPDVQEVVMSPRSDVIHALDDADGVRTVCGRDASDWLRGEQSVSKFIDSAYSCRRCVRAVFG